MYIDDIIVYSKNEHDHEKHLKQVFERLRKYNLTLKASKCSIGKSEVSLLGYIISAQGIRPQPQKTEAISQLANPTTVREVRSFLGMVGYYRKCIENFADHAEPLTRLTRKDEPFIWGPDQDEAFSYLKTALTTHPILAYPDTSLPYVLHTDASDKAVGAILTQVQEGTERVIAYLSHQLSGPQTRWAAIEREAYAVVYALDHLKTYLWGAEFEIFTDHKPLTSLFRAEIRNTKVQRWAIQISEFGAPIKYRKGKHNVRADMLSRIASVQVKPEPVVYPPEEYPLPWQAFGLDPCEMSQEQQREFPDSWKMAESSSQGFVIAHGYLYSNKEPFENAGKHLRLVTPSKWHHTVLETAHHQTGHQATQKTLDKIRESFVWPGMRNTVDKFIKACGLCGVYSKKSDKGEAGRLPTPPRPLHTWGLDLTGPFKPARGTGNQYILAAIDHLTGWVEAIPIKNKTNHCVWEAFMTHIVSRYGLPEVIITDKGGEFRAIEFDKFLSECGVRHNVTTPYHPQSNGRTERFNRTLKSILAKLIRNDIPEWEATLPEALWAYRTSWHASTGNTPYHLLYGLAPRQPQQPIKGTAASDRLQKLFAARRAAREAQDKKQEDTYNKRRMRLTSEALNIGDSVNLKEFVGQALSSTWDPGWMVVNIRGPVVKIVKDTVEKVVNRDKVKLAHGGLIDINPRATRRDRQTKWIAQPGPGLKTTLKRIAAAHSPTTPEWSSWLAVVSTYFV